MATKKSPRVIRAYSLSVELFDHLKGIQRGLQLVADVNAGRPAVEGDAHWSTASHALTHIVYTHRVLCTAAEKAGLSVNALLTALCVDGAATRNELGAIEVDLQ